MNIENNIIKHHLKNVYWIGGTACGGKTTAAKHLAEKHGFYHYNADEMFRSYKSIAHPKHQPALSKEFKTLMDYFNRPSEIYNAYLEQMNREAFEMMVVDLLKLSVKQPVVVEGHYPPELMLELADHDRIVFFYAEDPVIDAAQKQIEIGKRCNLKSFERTDKSTVEKTLQALENHFNI